MDNNLYVGVFFNKKTGIICLYSLETTPRFFKFNSKDDVKELTRRLVRIVNGRYGKTIVHINKISKKDQLKYPMYNKLIGIFIGLSFCNNVDFGIKTVPLEKTKHRIMTLLGIKRKQDFVSGLISKKAYGNQYNVVYQITNMQSKASINIHRNAYLLAFYGYVKTLLRKYNKLGEPNYAKERTKIRSVEIDGSNP